MATAVKYRKQIMDLTNNLSEDKVVELINFAQFLKAKQEGFSYVQIKDSAEYVRKMRSKENGQKTSGKNYIDEIIEWQKSDF